MPHTPGPWEAVDGGIGNTPDIIAAAPDLLAALKAVLSNAYESAGGERIELQANQIAGLRIVIAKAEGK